MKLLLYCTKAKPYLYDDRITQGGYNAWYTKNNFQDSVNGKIVAECDFEVEEHKETTNDWLCMSLREKIVFGNLCEKANIDELECYKYANGKPLYAIHIKNLHIFDMPIDIRNYYNIAPRTMQDCMNQRALVKAPQNMCNAYDVYKNHYIVISIQPQWLCKILNGEKTIEVRKKVLKEML